MTFTSPPLRAAVLIGLSVGLMAASPRREYERNVHQATEEIKVYRGFDTALILRGTLLDPPMRAAMAAERKRLVNPSPQDHQAFVERMKGDEKAYFDVVFSASSPLPAADTFGESDAGWVVWLEADGEQQELVSIEQVRRPSGLHRQLYTHLNVWSDLWIARFERTVANPDHVVMHVGSGYGNGDLHWKGLRKRASTSR